VTQMRRSKDSEESGRRMNLWNRIQALIKSGVWVVIGRVAAMTHDGLWR